MEHAKHWIENQEADNHLAAGPDGDQNTPCGVEESRATGAAARDAEREAAGRVVHRHLGPLLDDREVHWDDWPSNGNGRPRRRRGGSGGPLHIKKPRSKNQVSRKRGIFLGERLGQVDVVSGEVGTKRKADESELVDWFGAAVAAGGCKVAFGLLRFSG